MSEAFPVEPILRPLRPAQCRGKQLYRLEEDFAYLSPAFGAITAPAGMVTDFASVPRIVWSYLSPEDPAILYASLIHDYLYGIGGRLPLRTLTRAECDSVLREAMLISGARRAQAAVAHRAVTWFGARNFLQDPAA
jgi:hypothetical protein